MEKYFDCRGRDWVSEINNNKNLQCVQPFLSIRTLYHKVQLRRSFSENIPLKCQKLRIVYSLTS